VEPVPIRSTKHVPVNESADRALAENVKQPEVTGVDHGMRIKDKRFDDCRFKIDD